ncbi:hypothetical protein ACFL5E_02575 [Candidatus Omnitrophota bacterium]
MKKALFVMMTLFLAVSVVLIGCGAPKAGSSREAIDTAKAMATVQEQTQYLVGQAESFIDSDEFQNAVDVLQYVLTYLDKDNPQAKELLQKAKDELAAKAKSAAKSFGL